MRPNGMRATAAPIGTAVAAMPSRTGAEKYSARWPAATPTAAYTFCRPWSAIWKYGRKRTSRPVLAGPARSHDDCTTPAAFTSDTPSAWFASPTALKAAITCASAPGRRPRATSATAGLSSPSALIEPITLPFMVWPMRSTARRLASLASWLR
jgi:hypothetical protein